MTLAQIKYTVEVAQTGSINKAAKNLFVSQSVISVSIRKLEDEIKHKLFYRSSRGISLTQFGKVFMSYITPIYAQIKNIDRMMLDVSKGYAFSLTYASSGWSFLTSILSDMFEHYKMNGIRVEAYEGLGLESLEFVANGTAEIGFDRRYTCHIRAHQSLCKSRTLQFFPVYLADVGITVGLGSPLYELDYDSISPQMLSNCTPIVHSFNDAGPYADIFERLNLPVSQSRIYTTSRASWGELLHKTNSYFVNSVIKRKDSADTAEWPRKTFRLEGTDIKSEFGWLKRTDRALSSVAAEMISRVSDYLTWDSSE